MPPTTLLHKRVGDLKYELLELIGSGTFGDVYRAVNTETGFEVAVKMENVEIQDRLKDEYMIYRAIGNEAGFPRIYHYAKENQYRILVMDILGPSLEELFERCFKKFTMKTVLMLADQMIENLATLHSKGYLHRDIKPDNFLIGRRNQSKRVYLIDFGLAYPFIESNHKRHILYEEGVGFVGTARFAALNVQAGLKASRRDDLESIGYCLIYFLRGSLPWEGVESTESIQKCDKILEIKQSTRIDELCKDYPVHFAIYLDYCRNLKYEEKPNYKYLRNLFQSLLKTFNQKLDYKYDWLILKFKDLQSEPNRALLSRFPEGECNQPAECKNKKKNRNDPNKKKKNWFQVLEKKTMNPNAIIVRNQKVNGICPNKVAEDVTCGEPVIADDKHPIINYDHLM